MGLIKNLKQLEQNINNVERYLAIGKEDEKIETQKLIKRGICFVAYSIGDEIRFAPSRFLGYSYNEIYKHLNSVKDGKETNKVISEILHAKPVRDEKLEQKYFHYCSNLGIKPNKTGNYGAPRRFWRLKLQVDFQDNDEMTTGEFPEGKVVERIHKARERNSQVVKIAKDNFKKTHTKLYCQACGFDFANKYGEIGKDFIEGHHTISVCDMTPVHRTRPEDIALLCANCHRMIHKRRPWLTMKDLSKLLKKEK